MAFHTTPIMMAGYPPGCLSSESLQSAGVDFLLQEVSEVPWPEDLGDWWFQGLTCWSQNLPHGTFPHPVER